jgi:hypothetical protein
MGREEWQRERDDALRRERWSLHGPNRVVKVVPLTGRQFGGIGSELGGYITVAKSIEGFTPEQIEKALGLPFRSLGNGAMIYSFSRLPMSDEYEFELTADHPGGTSPTWMSDPDFPSGSKKIHQWKIREGMQIPVAAGTEIRLQPGQCFRAWSR